MLNYVKETERAMDKTGGEASQLPLIAPMLLDKKKLKIKNYKEQYKDV